ncbi:GSCOCT00003739001.2-RA-CDS [Cotesia congregata]|uniref:Toll-likereceptor.8_Cc n=1 Tax=Cotesia congregata TaxID=51543 RepID=A0A8J2HNF1_COTCN|nr:GSCOCT00003739001.2-RA-CDS [Cotesia congregata]CAG5107364.1 Toll-likereceptor.8_Cc [Cotesia congregata]
MTWLQWCLALSLISSNWANECPKGKFCKLCEISGPGEYIISCINKYPIFMIEYKPETFLDVYCLGNNFTNFDLGSVKQVKPVQSLYFENCVFSDQVNLEKIVKNIFNDTVEELSFAKCKNLDTVLTQESLKHFKKLRILDLQRNNLSSLTSEPFKELSNLTKLNFAMNNLTELPPKFLNIPSLRKIELGWNKLEVIKRSNFKNLGRLVFLNLWKNNIAEIEANAFDNTLDLKSIYLYANKLRSIPQGIFSQLSKLETINLGLNNFTNESFPEDLFRYNNMLETLIMDSNYRNITTLPSGFLSNLTSLREIYMENNGFHQMPENFLWGTTNLTTLELQNNYISTIPRYFFRDLKNLKFLDMSGNTIDHLPNDVFESLRQLTNLNLAKNRIKYLSSNHLTGLSSLETLNMERNNMVQIDGNAFKDLEKLKVAYFSYNQLNLTNKGLSDEYGYRSPFYNCISTIEKIYVDHNNIVDMFQDWTEMSHLKILNVSHNKIFYLHARDLTLLSRKAVVDLTYNMIESINIYRNVYEKLIENYPHDVVIDIGNNPLKCDCEIYDLLQYFEGELPYLHNRFYLKAEDLKCDSPQKIKGLAVKNLKSKNFTCVYRDSENNDSKSCPNQCECTTRQSDEAFLVNCSYRGLKEAPQSFNNPGHHVEMDLSGNFLKTMPSLNQKGYENITILRLNNNNISSIDANNLSDTLEELYLDNNNMTELDGKVWKKLENSTKIKHLTLHENKWRCDCETRDLIDFIQHKRVKIPELEKVHCHKAKRPIFSTPIDEFCPSDLYWLIGICVGIALFGIVIGGISALYYRYQHEIKVWLYAHQWCLWFVTESELDKDKIYDAFISFSHKDEEFIVNELVPKLEQGPKPFKICVHYRDWMAGGWIPEQIAQSVDESRRTIVVLSPNFLESIWGKMEFRAAHNQALSDGRARVIVILYGDIQPSDITDPELKAYLTMNTYVQWGDPWFWDKLRYALPHCIIKKSKKNNIFENHQPTIKKVDEKYTESIS